MINAGELDRRITIERATELGDDFGNSILTWSTLALVSAKIEYLTDTEVWRAKQVQSSAEVRFTIRWGINVTSQDRIIYENKTYNIVGVKEIGRHEGQELTAAEEIG